MRRADAYACVKWPSENPPIFKVGYKPIIDQNYGGCRDLHVKFHPLDYAKSPYSEVIVPFPRKTEIIVD
jgi:hypothetical protein